MRAGHGFRAGVLASSNLLWQLHEEETRYNPLIEQLKSLPQFRVLTQDSKMTQELFSDLFHERFQMIH